MAQPETPSDTTNQDAAASEAEGHDETGHDAGHDGRKVKETQGEYVHEQVDEVPRENLTP